MMNPKAPDGASLKSSAQLLRVAFLVGSQKAVYCGVRDNAEILAGSFAASYTADVVAPATWSVRNVLELFRTIRAGKYDIVHIQYPSIGYRYTLVPHLLGFFRLARATAVTLHEYSAFTWPQRLSTQVFRLSADLIFFGSEFEQERYNRRLGPLGPNQRLFPILSNIPATPAGADDRDLTVVYFGQIRPNKGIEDFLELARLSLAQNRPFRFEVIGSISKTADSYARELQQRSPAEVQWSLNLEADAVSRVLGYAFAAYLPFPDGASERRGSLVASLANGLPVVSQAGPATTPALASTMLEASGPEEALTILDDLLSAPDMWKVVSERALAHAAANSWTNVARSHADAYMSILT